MIQLTDTFRTMLLQAMLPKLVITLLIRALWRHLVFPSSEMHKSCLSELSPVKYRESLLSRHYLKRRISASRNDKNNLKKAS